LGFQRFSNAINKSRADQSAAASNADVGLESDIPPFVKSYPKTNFDQSR